MTSSAPGQLAGKVAMITGAASGIGAGTARRFIAEGARVVLADVEIASGQALATELGEGSFFTRTDVTREEDIAAAVDLAIERFGRLDVMFNNAGVIGAVGSIAETRAVDADLTIAVNLRGVLFGMKHAARVMRPQGSGVILSTSSPAGVLGGLGAHVYSATKAAVIGLSQSVAAELRRYGIRVNTIIPGATVTGMTAELTAGDRADLDGATERMSAGALMHRPVLPADIAGAAVYLAGDDAAFITGCTLPVDAGLTWAGGPSPYATGEHERAGVFGANRES